MPSNSKARKLKAEQFRIFTTVEDNPKLLDLLEIATTSARKIIFIESLIDVLPLTTAFARLEKEPAQLFDIFTIWFGIYPQSDTFFKQVHAALYYRRKYYLDFRSMKRQFISDIGLDWTPHVKSLFFKKIKPTYLSKLKTPYPPIYNWIVESETIRNLWQDHFDNGPQPDRRHKRYPLFLLDPAKLKYDTGTDTDHIIYDKETKELVMVVIRNFTEHPGLLAYMADIIKANVAHRKNMRLADPGSLVQLGISSGARSKPSFGWVKNISSKKLSDDFVDDLDRKTAHAFSILWMLIRRKLPDEVSDDLITWLAETGMYRMNKEIVHNLREQSDKGEIELDIGDFSFNFQWAELAPPSGLMAANYSRYIHHEMNQPHKFGIAWTISRTLADDGGGHFYNSKYGICVKGGSDSLVVWDPSHFHGTSLQDYPPSLNMLTEFYQVGMACVTPNRIPGLWKRYAMQQASLEEVKEGVLSDSDGE